MNQHQDSQEASDQSTDEGDLYSLPSPWQLQGRDRTVSPKNEHPSTYDESIPPLSYRAQDYGQAPSSPPKAEPSTGASSNAGANPTSTKKTAQKMAYPPYSQYTGGWQVPSWAKPQQNNFGTVWVYGLFTIGVLIFPALCFLINLIGSQHNAFLSILLIPLVALIALVLLVALVLAFGIIAILWVIRKVTNMKPPSWW